MNNCGEYVHKQVIENGLLPVLVKIVKKKVGFWSYSSNPNCLSWPWMKFATVLQTHFPVRERVFLLLDATQTALGGASGKFPEYYAAYYDLVVLTRSLKIFGFS